MMAFPVRMTCILSLFLSLSEAGVIDRNKPVSFGRVVPIPAGTKAHYNIQNYAGPGTYKFGYDTGSGPNQSFRQEERGTDGIVKGRYGYVETSGALRVVEYMADSSGFHILRSRTLVPDMKPKPAVKVETPFVGPLPPFIPTSYVVNYAG